MKRANKKRRGGQINGNADIFFKIPWWAYLGFAIAWYCGIDLLTDGMVNPAHNNKMVNLLFNSSTKIIWSIIQLFFSFLSIYFGIISSYHKQQDPNHSKDLILLVLSIFLLVTIVITIDEGAEASFNKRIKEKFLTKVDAEVMQLK